MTSQGRSGRRQGSRCAAARWAFAALVASMPGLAGFTSGTLGAQDSATVRRPAPDSTPARIAIPLRVVDAGPGVSGRMLREIVAAAHVTMRGDTTRPVLLRRDTTFDTTVVVLGGDVLVAGHVRGDLVAIGGDVFLRPGARIDGRAIAYGGAVYPSALAVVRGGLFSYRDHTFVPTERADVIELRYRDLEGYPVPTVAFPLYGLQIPEYTRVDGLALGVGPTITLAEGGVEIVPTVTYRSHLGALDPRAVASVRLGRRTRLLADVGRATFSNDRWIRSNLINSLTTFASGTDTRNYFRADRAEARVQRSWEGAATTLVPFVGARVERAWSTGPDSLTETAPFALFGRHNREGILRPNPPVVRGRIASALAGGTLEWQSPQRVTVAAALQVEQSFDGPTAAFDRFTQVTGHVDLGFPTFGTQTFDLRAHGVATGGEAPPQRWAYLGGNGTLQTLDLLEMGGDRLAYVESNYNIPIDRIQVPFVGPPVVTLRHAIGSAGVGRLPDFVQNVGVRITLAVIRLDYALDPASGDHSAGVSFVVPFGF